MKNFFSSPIHKFNNVTLQMFNLQSWIGGVVFVESLKVREEGTIV